MAEGGTTENVDEKGDRPGDERLSQALGNQIGRIGMVLLKDYINHGFDQKNMTEAPRVEGVEPESMLSTEELETCKNLGQHLQRMGDAIQNDESLRRQIECLPEKPKIETIMTVASVLFGDTKDINWGRIITLFCFTLEMCVRAVRYFTTKDELISWFKELIIEMALFIVRHFSNWIMANGGWNGILTYFSTYPSMVWVAVLTVSAITAIYVVYKYRQK